MGTESSFVPFFETNFAELLDFLLWVCYNINKDGNLS